MKKPTGIKYDQDKNRLDLLSVEALQEIGKILTYGAKKYTPDNWKKVPNLYRRYYGALLRHMFAWWVGEKVDPETKITHLAHAGACIMFLLGAELKGIQMDENPGTIEEKRNKEIKRGKKDRTRKRSTKQKRQRSRSRTRRNS